MNSVTIYCRSLLIVICCVLSFHSFSRPTGILSKKSIELQKDSLPRSGSVDTTVFDKTDIGATTDTVTWRKHLQVGLMDVIISAAKAGMKVGKYTIHVRFIVEKDGSISNVHALDDLGYGTKKAVEKIVRTGPKWVPAEIGGEKVRSYKTQPVTFMILSNFN